MTPDPSSSTGRPEAPGDEDGPAPVQAQVQASSEARRGDPRLLALVLAVALLVWVIDQTTKWLATERLQGRAPVQVIGDWLTLDFLRNSGAAFGLGTSTTFVFTAIAVVVAVVVVRVARRLGSVWWAIALGGLLGGAVGNLTDRLFREPGFPGGHVVDFISVKYFAVFNCADMAVVGSAILMVVLSLLGIELSGHRRGGPHHGDVPAADASSGDFQHDDVQHDDVQHDDAQHDDAEAIEPFLPRPDAPGAA